MRSRYAYLLGGERVGWRNLIRVFRMAWINLFPQLLSWGSFDSDLQVQDVALQILPNVLLSLRVRSTGFLTGSFEFELWVCHGRFQRACCWLYCLFGGFRDANRGYDVVTSGEYRRRVLYSKSNDSGFRINCLYIMIIYCVA